MQEGGFLLNLHFENLVVFLEVKPTKCWESPKALTTNLKFFHNNLQRVLNNLSKWPLGCSRKFIPPVASASGKQISVATLWIFLFLQICSGGLPCKLSSLMWSRKLTYFQFVLLFLVLRTGVIILKLYIAEVKLKIALLFPTLFFLSVFF